MMHALASIGLSNAAVAVVLAIAALVVTRVWRSPPLAHALWLLVLLKFVSPPLVGVALPLLTATAPSLEQPHDFVADRATETGKVVESSDEIELRNTPPAYSQELSVPPDSPELFVAPSPSDFSRLLQSPGPSGPFVGDAPAASVDSEAPREADATSPPPPPPAAIQPTTRPGDQDSRGVAVVWPYLVGVWLAGATIWFAVVGVRLRRFRLLLERTEAAPAALRVEVATLAARIGLHTAPDTRIVDAAIPPLAWAMTGRPVLLLPRELIGRLDDDERTTLLAHELAHLRRRDHLLRWLEIVVLGLYWWQPVAWFARRQLHRAAEACCDAWVVRNFPQYGRAYAQALLKTVEFLAEADAALPVGATGFGQAKLLKRRFAMILEGRRPDRLSRVVRYGLALVGLVVLPLSIRTLWADESQPQTPAAAASATEVPVAAAPGTEVPATAAPATTPLPAPTDATPPAATAPPAGSDTAAAVAPKVPEPGATLSSLAAPAQPQYRDDEPEQGATLSNLAAPLRQQYRDPFKPEQAPVAIDSGDLDRRLRRLESMMESLVRELKSKPRPAYQTVPSDAPPSSSKYAVPPTTYPSASAFAPPSASSASPVPQLAPPAADAASPPRNIDRRPVEAPVATDKPPQSHERLSAPVFYQKQTLVVVSRAGVAAIDFGETFDDGHDKPDMGSPNAVSYRYRFLSSADGKEQSGEDRVAERYTLDRSGHFYIHGPRRIKAGDITLDWSRSGKNSGFIYYTPEEMAVMIVNSDFSSDHGDFEAIDKLDLKRFRNVIR